MGLHALGIYDTIVTTYVCDAVWRANDENKVKCIYSYPKCFKDCNKSFVLWSSKLKCLADLKLVSVYSYLQSFQSVISSLQLTFSIADFPKIIFI